MPIQFDVRRLPELPVEQIRSLFSNPKGPRRKTLASEIPGIFDTTGEQEPPDQERVIAMLAAIGQALVRRQAMRKMCEVLQDLQLTAKVYVFEGVNLGKSGHGLMSVEVRPHDKGCSFLRSTAQTGDQLMVAGVRCTVLYNGFQNLGDRVLHWLVLDPVEGDLPDQSPHEVKIDRRRLPVFTPGEKVMMRLLELEFRVGDLLKSWVTVGTIRDQAQLGDTEETVKRLIFKLQDAGMLENLRGTTFGTMYRATPQALEILELLDYDDEDED